MRGIYIILFLILTSVCKAGGIDTTFALPTTNRNTAIQEIKSLKHGALVVRLKTNDKSIEAYRNAGQNTLADKLVEERAELNKKIMEAFKYYFTFCKVYFIFSKNSQDLVKHQPNIFLNEKLQIDTTIKLKEDYFLIAEYGSFTSNERTDEYHYSGVNNTQPSSSTAGASALVILDTAFNQLQEPFPFVSPVYIGTFIKAVVQLDRQLDKFYMNVDLKEYWNRNNMPPGNNPNLHAGSGASPHK